MENVTGCKLMFSQTEDVKFEYFYLIHATLSQIKIFLVTLPHIK